MKIGPAPAYLSILALAALFAPVIAPNDPYGVDLSSRLLPPCPQFLFGTDHLGRCLLSRMIHGARISLGMGTAIMGVSLVLGGGLGALAGMAQGFVDGIIMRLTDTFMALPSIVFAMVLSRYLGPGPFNLILVFSLTLWTRYARMIRSLVLDTIRADHVETARMAGLPGRHILFAHILPSVLPPVAAMATMGMGMNILMVSSLSFLGLGIVEPVPDWGAMLGTGADYFRTAPHMAFFPGLVISLTVLSFNSMGDRIRKNSKSRPQKGRNQ